MKRRADPLDSIPSARKQGGKGCRGTSNHEAGTLYIARDATKKRHVLAGNTPRSTTWTRYRIVPEILHL
jgi:hypothetical protein